MASFDFNNDSHKRFNPLTKSWVLCSPHRTKRPWQGQQEEPQLDQRPSYDATCYLCPGNKRANGEYNEKYETTFTFPNDFAAVKKDQPEYIKSSGKINNNDRDEVDIEEEEELFRVKGVRGECHVICFSPRHDLTMAEMTVEEIGLVVQEWTKNYQKIKIDTPWIEYVQIFENKGSAMGCSNPHPHGQMWCTEITPQEPQQEFNSLIEYRKKHGDHRCLLCDYVKRELKQQQRIVVENDSFVCLVPFWAVWPFETMVLSKRHCTDLLDLGKDNQKEQQDLADILRRITCRYDNLFKCSFPYSMGIHQAPTHGDGDHAHFHMHFYPPLLRSATVKKFLVGFELLGEPQRDLTPEQAAQRLRDCSEIHYKQL